MIEEQLLQQLNSLDCPATEALEIALRQNNASERFVTSNNIGENSNHCVSYRRRISFDVGEIVTDIVPTEKSMLLLDLR